MNSMPMITLLTCAALAPAAAHTKQPNAGAAPSSTPAAKTAKPARAAAPAKAARPATAEPLRELKSSVQVTARYFSPVDSGFKDIYGGGLQYSGALTRQLGRRWDAWLEASRVARKGELTFTHEPTKMSLLRVAAGARYRFGSARLVPYASAGLGFYRFSESNPIGDVSKGGLGALAKVGVLIGLSRRVQGNLDVGYSHCRLKPADVKVNLSGFEVGSGLALRF